MRHFTAPYFELTFLGIAFSLSAHLISERPLFQPSVGAFGQWLRGGQGGPLRSEVPRRTGCQAEGLVSCHLHLPAGRPDLRKPAQGPAERLPAPIMFSGEAARPWATGKPLPPSGPAPCRPPPYDETRPLAQLGLQMHLRARSCVQLW